MVAINNCIFRRQAWQGLVWGMKAELSKRTLSLLIVQMTMSLVEMQKTGEGADLEKQIISSV